MKISHLSVCFGAKCLSILALPATIFVFDQAPASAILRLNIFEDGPNLKVNLVGSLSQLPSVSLSGYCGADGALIGEFAGTSIDAAACGGPGATPAATVSLYSIAGPAGFGGNGSLIGASSVSGSSFWFAASDYSLDSTYQSKLGIDPSYVLGSPYFGEAIFNNQSLASQGFVDLGLVGTWTIDGTSESIRVCIGSDQCAPPVPGPFPLLGAGAAFGFARRMRRRISAPIAKLPEA